MTDRPRTYTVKHVRHAHMNLEPLICVQCGAQEVTYHQAIGDGYCANCGQWQED